MIARALLLGGALIVVACHAAPPLRDRFDIVDVDNGHVVAIEAGVAGIRLGDIAGEDLVAAINGGIFETPARALYRDGVISALRTGAGTVPVENATKPFASAIVVRRRRS